MEEKYILGLRCSDVRFRRIDTTTTRRVTEKLSNQYSRAILSGDEILLNVRGTLGGCAITTQEHKGFNIVREVSLIVLHYKKHGLDIESVKSFNDDRFGRALDKLYLCRPRYAYD